MVDIDKDDLDWPIMAIEEIVDAPDDPVDEPKIQEVDSSSSDSDSASDGDSDSDDQTDSDDQADDDDTDGGNGAEPTVAAALGEDVDGGQREDVDGGVGGLITVLSETTIDTGADETSIAADRSTEGST